MDSALIPDGVKRCSFGKFLLLNMVYTPHSIHYPYSPSFQQNEQVNNSINEAHYTIDTCLCIAIGMQQCSAINKTNEIDLTPSPVSTSDH